jgi:hypothetical protein
VDTGIYKTYLARKNNIKEKYKRFYMMFDKGVNNLILCSKTLNDGGVIQEG